MARLQKRMVAAVLLLGAMYWAPAPAATAQEPAGADGRPAAGQLPATLPLRRDAGESTEPGYLAPMLGLLFLAVGAAGAWWWWRRAASRTTGPQARAEKAQVLRVSSQALTQHASVHAVQWRGEEYLLGTTAQQVTLIATRTLPSRGGQP